MKAKDKKPRVRFCWHCGAKLWGNNHKEVVDEIGNVHIVHKTCGNAVRECHDPR